LRFPIDECLHTSLVAIGNEKGFEAYHVVHRGLPGIPDYQLCDLAQREELTLVTNNGKDFRKLMIEASVHPGLVIIKPCVEPEQQRKLFGTGLQMLSKLPDLINRVMEIDIDGTITLYDLP
jgi:predicted nuclease of predicted toxin-antitoxin system